MATELEELFDLGLKAEVIPLDESEATRQVFARLDELWDRALRRREKQLESEKKAAQPLPEGAA